MLPLIENSFFVCVLIFRCLTEPGTAWSYLLMRRSAKTYETAFKDSCRVFVIAEPNRANSMPTQKTNTNNDAVAFVVHFRAFQAIIAGAKALYRIPKPTSAKKTQSGNVAAVSVKSELKARTFAVATATSAVVESSFATFAPSQSRFAHTSDQTNSK